MIKLSESTINLQLISYIVVKDNAFPVKLGAIKNICSHHFYSTNWTRCPSTCDILGKGKK